MLRSSKLRRLLPFLVIIVLAFGYRLIVMAERAAAPNDISAWNPLPEGSDQLTYITYMQDLIAGDYPSGPFYYQPGIVYFLAAVATLIQSNELFALRLALVCFASLNCGLVAYFTAWATGRRRAGLLAGLLMALYPVSAYYDTDFIIASPALILTTLMLAFTVWALRHPRNLLIAFVIGALVGAAIITRFQLIAPGFVCFAWLLLCGSEGIGGRIRQFLPALIGVLLLALPVILHNRAGGAHYLFVPIGPRVFYYGNARDAEGIASQSNAEWSTEVDYFHYFLHDVALEPGRFIELWLHKAGVFLSSIVTGQNLDYQKFRDGVSGTQALNPLNFSALLVLALAGWLLLWRKSETRRLALLLVAGFCSYMLAVMATYVETRFKIPVIVWMLPAAGFALDQLIRALPRERLGLLLPRCFKHLLVLPVLLLAIQFAARELPRDVIVADLPSSATAAGLRYDDTLELVGWQVRTQYSPANTIEPFHPWVVSLYWRLLGPTEVDYTFSLKYIIEGEAVIEYDRPIGFAVYPRDQTSEWQVGAIYVEHIGLIWDAYSGPFERTGSVMLDVYRERETHAVFFPLNNAGERVARPLLAQPAILLAPGRNSLPTTTEVSFGEQMILLGYQLPEKAEPKESVHIRTAWRAGEKQIESSYAVGVYLFRDGVFIANQDGPPVGGRLQTFSLLPGYHFDDEKSLALPDEAGIYDVYIGVYDMASMQRLPLENEQDNLHHIGSIAVN